MKKNIIIIIILIMFLPLKLIKAYTFNDPQIPKDIQSLLNEVSTTWPSSMDQGRIEVIIQGARLMGKGIKYIWGAGHSGCQDNPTGLDCSGYVSLALNRAGIKEIQCDWFTGTYAASSSFTTINESDLLPGDIGLNNLTQSENNHIGLYVGKKSGQNIWFHSTNNSNSGPQVRYGNGRFAYFRRYNKWNEIHLNSYYGGQTGIGGEITGSLEDKYPSFDSINSSENFTCETIFYYQNIYGDKVETNFKKVMDGIFVIMKIASPILAIILIIIDYIKLLISSDAKNIKKTNAKTVKRIIITITIMLIPYLLELLFKLFGLYDLSTCGIS